MDYRLPLSVSQKDIDALSTKLPRINSTQAFTSHDVITTQLRGVLHPHYSLPEINSLLVDFLMDTEYLPKQLGNYNRENRMIKGIVGGKDGGVAAEYFFIDYLMRNSHLSNHYSFAHRKGPYTLDHNIKADLLTTVTYRRDDYLEPHIFGTQLHYNGMKIPYPHTSIDPFTKELAVFNGISLDTSIISALPEALRPEIPCFVKLNSEFLQKNNDTTNEDSTLFSSAMKTWMKNGFHGGGPTSHLSRKYRDQLMHMSYFYQNACKSFLRFLYQLYEGKEADREFSSYTSHKSALRVNRYDPLLKRASYDFFHKNAPHSLFMTIIFRITPQLEERFQQIVARNKGEEK